MEKSEIQRSAKDSIEKLKRDMLRRRDDLLSALAELEEARDTLSMLSRIDSNALQSLHAGKLQFPLYGIAQTISVRAPETATLMLVTPCLRTVEYMLDSKGRGALLRKLMHSTAYRELRRVRSRLAALQEAIDNGEEPVHPMADIIAFIQANAPEKTPSLVSALLDTCSEAITRIRTAINNYDSLKLQ